MDQHPLDRVLVGPRGRAKLTGELARLRAERAELVAALRLYQAAFQTVHPITGEVFCEFLPSITPVVKETRALLAKLGETP